MSTSAWIHICDHRHPPRRGPNLPRTYGRGAHPAHPRRALDRAPTILRERQGLTGGVGGFFAKRCVEIDAQAAPRLSVYADDDVEARGAAEATASSAPMPSRSPPRVPPCPRPPP